jgi:hypothetical protein
MFSQGMLKWVLVCAAVMLVILVGVAIALLLPRF